MDEKALIIVIGDLVTHLGVSDVLPKRLGNKIHKALGVKPPAKRKPTVDIGVDVVPITTQEVS